LLTVGFGPATGVPAAAQGIYYVCLVGRFAISAAKIAISALHADTVFVFALLLWFVHRTPFEWQECNCITKQVDGSK
jgi:hypothetical protein